MKLSHIHVLALTVVTTLAWVVPSTSTRPSFQLSSDWVSFEALEDDLLDPIDTKEYALEEDSQDVKAQVGATLEPPEIERPADPIQVPAGM